MLGREKIVIGLIIMDISMVMDMGTIMVTVTDTAMVITITVKVMATTTTGKATAIMSTATTTVINTIPKNYLEPAPKCQTTSAMIC
jgi:hypothetical protein